MGANQGDRRLRFGPIATDRSMLDAGVALNVFGDWLVSPDGCRIGQKNCSHQSSCAKSKHGGLSRQTAWELGRTHGILQRAIRGGDEAGVYLGAAVSAGSRPLVTLPSSRGRMRGLSRPIVRAVAEMSGRDPSTWHREGTRLTTWGGIAYNVLLRGVLVASGHTKGLKADPFGLSGLEGHHGFNPAAAADLAREVLDSRRLPIAIAEKFREGTQFLRELSSELQREEARRSVPRDGFIQWLQECG